MSKLIFPGSFIAKNSDDLIKLVKYAHKNKYRIFFLGSGSNVLASDKGLNGIVITLKKALNKIIKENTGIEENYQAEFNEAFARASYYEAQYFMSIGDSVSASHALSHFKYNGFFISI